VSKSVATATNGGRSSILTSGGGDRLLEVGAADQARAVEREGHYRTAAQRPGELEQQVVARRDALRETDVGQRRGDQAGRDQLVPAGPSGGGAAVHQPHRADHRARAGSGDPVHGQRELLDDFEHAEVGEAARAAAAEREHEARAGTAEQAQPLEQPHTWILDPPGACSSGCPLALPDLP
jgi:hypothetical protein